MIVQIVFTVIAVLAVSVCINMFRKGDFRRTDVSAGKHGAHLLAFTFVALLTGALVFLAIGYWLD